MKGSIFFKMKFLGIRFNSFLHLGHLCSALTTSDGAMILEYLLFENW